MKITYAMIKEKAGSKPYTIECGGRDAQVIQKAVNVGIDSYLEACFVPDRGDSYVVNNGRLDCSVSAESLPTLIRRLTEFSYTEKEGGDRDTGSTLARDILDSLGFNVEFETDFKVVRSTERRARKQKRA